jgi:hypothetical protein
MRHPMICERLPARAHVGAREFEPPKLKGQI